MLPAQRNKVDISKLTPQEQQLFAKYGKLPTHKNILMKMQKERKYFDSGDYALSKAGVAPQSTVGTAIPNPESIPHASSSCIGNGHSAPSISPTTSTSPVNRESNLAHYMKSKSEQEEDEEDEGKKAADKTEESSVAVSTTVTTTNATTTEGSDAIMQDATVEIKENTLAV